MRLRSDVIIHCAGGQAEPPFGLLRTFCAYENVCFLSSGRRFIAFKFKLSALSLSCERGRCETQGMLKLVYKALAVRVELKGRPNCLQGTISCVVAYPR